MDIFQFSYFMRVVESSGSLTLASKKQISLNHRLVKLSLTLKNQKILKISFSRQVKSFGKLINLKV